MIQYLVRKFPISKKLNEDKVPFMKAFRLKDNLYVPCLQTTYIFDDNKDKICFMDFALAESSTPLSDEDLDVAITNDSLLNCNFESYKTLDFNKYKSQALIQMRPFLPDLTASAMDRFYDALWTDTKKDISSNVRYLRSSQGRSR